MLCNRAVNALFFRIKRAHHSCLRVSREILGTLITPARFDLMFALEACRGRNGYAFQKELCVLLGVSDATVSRMVSSLVELGLLARDFDVLDGRRRCVVLTDEGRRLMVRLRAEVHRQGEHQRRLAAALSPPMPECSGRNHQALVVLLGLVTRAFGDFATLDYRAPGPPPDYVYRSDQRAFGRPHTSSTTIWPAPA